MVKEQRSICLSMDIDIEGKKCVRVFFFVCARECRCVCPKSAAAAAGKEWDLCSKQPAGYLKASGPVLD